MIGGLTKCLKVFDDAQTKSGLAGLLVGQLVLLRGEVGHGLYRLEARPGGKVEVRRL